MIKICKNKQTKYKSESKGVSTAWYKLIRSMWITQLNRPNESFFKENIFKQKTEVQAQAFETI